MALKQSISPEATPQAGRNVRSRFPLASTGGQRILKSRHGTVITPPVSVASNHKVLASDRLDSVRVETLKLMHVHRKVLALGPLEGKTSFTRASMRSNLGVFLFPSFDFYLWCVAQNVLMRTTLCFRLGKPIEPL